MQTVPYDDVIASLPSMEKVTNNATCSCKTTLTQSVNAVNVTLGMKIVTARTSPAKSMHPERARLRPTLGLFRTSRLNAYAGISTAALRNYLMF